MEQRSFAETADRSTDASARPLTRPARASVTSLCRALEVFDPPAARRAALRAHLVDRLAVAAGSPIADRVDAITGALLAEISIILTHVRPLGTVDIVPDPASAVLSASVLTRLSGLGGTARTVRHQYERWDGSGGPHGMRGPDIPLAARLLALAATLVGNPSPGAAPNWTSRQRRVDELLGTALDPDLGAAAHLELTSGEPLQSDVELDQVLDGLERFVPPERNSPVEALVSIGAAVRAADSMPDVLLVIAEHARRALQASTVTIGRLDHETAEYETLLNVGDLGRSKERFPAEERHGVDDQPGLDTIFEGQGFVRATDDGRADDPGIVSLYQRGLRSEALWPINIGDSLWGLVIATTRAESNILDHDDLATLRLVATHIAAAVSQAQRIAEFEELALRDPLTGLGNRRVLDERLQDVFSRPPVDRQDVAVVMCDVDGLKVVNDNEGHASGDSLLVDAARSLADAADTVENSTVCRIGGDEFCVILDGGGMLSAHPVTDLALQLFAKTGHNRSLSCGVALATADILTPGDLLRRADEMQYEEKRRRKGLPPLADLPALTDRRRARREPNE
ncbi:MAG: diguanylate cyclase (GGDEF)-like protein [Candidatus Aldehydirespiratoraceae bacterium]|jgi:diguanylate cyclase (GGDEF)-like protein